jgi:hypothetical protein
MNASLSTLCYIEKEGKYLMLHRTVKKNDVNKDNGSESEDTLNRTRVRKNVS